MKGLNKVTLMGNIGRDPEIRYIEENVAVCTISLATSESYTNKTGERITQTDWHNVVFWRGAAEVIEKYVKKGDPLYVEGRIRTRSYPDKEHPSITRYVTEIVASDFRLLSRRDSSESPGAPRQEPAVVKSSTTVRQNGATAPSTVPEAPPADAFDDDDDLPF